MKRIDFRRSDGVAMTEFALIVPVFLLIVAGLLGFGRFLFYWIDANHLANETARWAVVDRNPYAPSGAAPPGTGGKTLQQEAADTVNAEFKQGVSVCISFPSSVAIGEPITVTVKKPFTLLPIVQVGTLTIAGSATMRIERFANGTSPTAYSTSQNVGTCS